MTTMQDPVQATTHQVALSFEDGVTRFISCAEDQTVADASYRSRINIPLDCRDGACGTCKALCESGEYDGGTYVPEALSDDEATAGYVLPCSMRPRSDLVLRINSTSDFAKTRAASFTGRLVELDRLSPTTVSFSIEIPNRKELAFLPGQYVNIPVPGTEVGRSYSFSNAVGEPRLRFLVKLTPGGAMSTYLTDRARVGDEITFTGPHGSFFLREARRPVLQLAGGSGLAPMLSMLRTLRAAGSTRPVHLIYGVTTDDDLVGRAELDELARDLPVFSWEYCVASPDSTAPNKGYVTSLLRADRLHGGDIAVYLWGPPPMVEAARRHFIDLGVEPTGFYYEKFALAASAPAAAGAMTEAVRSAEPWRVRRAPGLPPAVRLLTDEDDEPLTLASDAARLLGRPVFPQTATPEPAPPVTTPPRFVTPGRFAGKVVLVTGAAQGIGERTAWRIAAEGGALVLADRAELVKEFADELSANGQDALAVTADLEQWEGAQSVVAQALARFGRIDVAIHTVGGTIWAKPFEHYPPGQIVAEINRSLWPTLWSCRAVIGHMIERGSGVIVNVSSIATRGIHRVPYAAAKGGVNAITSALAVEAAQHGVRVVATAPGGTEAPARRVPRGPAPRTELEREWYQAIVDQTVGSSLLKRYGTLEEQAAAICFLASDEASYITATVLPVGGGDLG